MKLHHGEDLNSAKYSARPRLAVCCRQRWQYQTGASAEDPSGQPLHTDNAVVPTVKGQIIPFRPEWRIVFQRLCPNLCGAECEGENAGRPAIAENAELIYPVPVHIENDGIVDRVVVECRRVSISQKHGSDRFYVLRLFSSDFLRFP